MNLISYILLGFVLRSDRVLGENARIVGGAPVEQSGGQKIPSMLPLRIVGGNTATKHYPFMVSYQLRYSYYSKHAPFDIEQRFNDWAHFCGAAIISKRYVVTAGHCLKGYDVVLEHVSFLAGTNKLSVDGTRYEIASYLVHDGFEETQYGTVQDIAIIKSACTIFPVKDKIAAITYNKEIIGSGVSCTVMGWGYTVQGSHKSDDLLELKTKTISNQECVHVGLVGVGDPQMCTFTKLGEGFCQADSGGPLVKDNKLIGIVSYNAGCGAGNPDVYIRVSYYYDWLQANTRT